MGRMRPERELLSDTEDISLLLSQGVVLYWTMHIVIPSCGSAGSAEVE